MGNGEWGMGNGEWGDSLETPWRLLGDKGELPFSQLAITYYLFSITNYPLPTPHSLIP
jgi:hypothetical protein